VISEESESLFVRVRGKRTLIGSDGHVQNRFELQMMQEVNCWLMK
jgi:hypothetical protein